MIAGILLFTKYAVIGWEVPLHGLCVTMCMLTEPRDWCWIFSSVILCLILWNRPVRDLELTILTRLAGSEFPGPVVLASSYPSTGNDDMQCCIQPLSGSCRSELQHTCLCTEQSSQFNLFLYKLGIIFMSSLSMKTEGIKSLQFFWKPNSEAGICISLVWLQN